jgi:hypothetical protein
MDSIIDAVQNVLHDEAKTGEIPPLWDGCTAKRIVEILRNKLVN